MQGVSWKGLFRACFVYSAQILAYGNRQLPKVESVQVGYFYNVGSGRYLGVNSRYADRQQYLEAVANEADAMSLLRTRVFQDQTTFTIISPNKPGRVRGQNGVQYDIYSSLPIENSFGIVGGWNFNRVGLESHTTAETHRFTISEPHTASGEELQIYMHGECLEVDRSYSLVRAPCISTFFPSFFTNKDIQAFTWVSIDSPSAPRTGGIPGGPPPSYYDNRGAPPPPYAGGAAPFYPEAGRSPYDSPYRAPGYGNGSQGRYSPSPMNSSRCLGCSNFD
ncbi:hypothetical protein NEDG_02092 [Nematocida displodere]|uniref:Uncharacterized protein n=1 Tax=Nematocida displodere TaxID=1805483 RepID=A0A177EJL5_9MICR|nr:hypothetical protein NEDG_02092 [Nematocida displodere]